MAICDVSERSIEELVSLSGRTALVTGGAQGLGRAIVSRLAEAGAKVAIADLDQGRGRSAAREIAARHGVEAMAVAMDVRDVGSIENAAARAEKELGPLDIWVNNAGIFPFSPVMELEPEELDRVLDVNLRGTMAGCAVAAVKMAATERPGVIVNICSVSGFIARSPGVAAYVSSKHGVRGLTRQLAIELSVHDIRVLGVAPAFCTTEGTVAGLGEGVRSRLTSKLGRIGVPDDVARVVLFCASDMALFLSGTTLLADAGEIA